MPPRRSLSTLLAGVVLFAVAFGSTLTSSFHFDDYHMLQDPVVTDASGWWEVFRPERTRPLTYLSFWLNYQIGGDAPVGYHLFNLVLHGLTAWLAWGLFQSFVRPRAALLAAAVFAFHPIQTEPVAYVFARATILATLFAVLSWRAWTDKRYWQSTLWFAAALLAKEEVAALPLFFAGCECFCSRTPVANSRSWLKPWGAMWVLVAAAGARLLYAASVTQGSGFAFDLGQITPLSYLLTQGRAVWLYAQLLFVPVGLNFDRDFSLSTGLDAATVVAWIALAAVVVFAVRRARLRPHWYWLLGTLFLLAPTSSVAPLAYLVAERRLYLPLISASLGLGMMLARLPRFAGFAAVLMLAGLSSYRTWDWQTEESLWRATEAASPNKVRPKLQLARALGANGQEHRDEQHRLLREAEQLDSTTLDVATELGVFYLQTGRPAHALEQFELVLDSPADGSPGDPQARANYGAALYLLGRRDEARWEFEQVLAADPCNFDSRNNLILLHRTAGRSGEALERAAEPRGCRLPTAQREALRATREELADAASGSPR